MRLLRAACVLGAVFLFMMVHVHCQTTAIFPVLRPLKYVAHEGHLNTTFRCTITDVDTDNVVFFWTVNGLPPSDEAVMSGTISRTPTRTLNGTIAQATLTIAATTSNKNTTIQCFRIITPTLAYSNEATFMVQGNLGECVNISVQPMGSFYQKLCWDSPYTLDITDIEPDIFGYIICTSLSTNCSYINIREHGSDEPSLRQFVFPNLQTSAEINVSAVNIVGEGNTTTVVTQPCSYDSEPSQLPEDRFTAAVSLMSSELPTVKVHFQSGGSCFDIYLVAVEEFPLEEGSGLTELTAGSAGSGIAAAVTELRLIPEVRLNGTVTLTISSELSENQHYKASITTLRDQMQVGAFNFHTFDVQDVRIIEVTDTQISVECTFASGSEARGCAVGFTNRNTVPEEFEFFFRTLDDSPVSLPLTAKGNISAPEKPYTVFIYDIEKDGSIPSTPVSTHLVEASKVEPSPSPSPMESNTPPAVDGTKNSSEDSSFPLLPATAAAAGILIILAILVIVAILVVVVRRRRSSGSMDVTVLRKDSRSVGGGCVVGEDEQETGEVKENYTEHTYAVLEGPAPVEDYLSYNPYDNPGNQTTARVVSNGVANGRSPHHSTVEDTPEHQTTPPEHGPTYETVDALAMRRHRSLPNANSSSRTSATCRHGSVNGSAIFDHRPMTGPRSGKYEGISLDLLDKDLLYDQVLPPMTPTTPVLPTPTSITPLLHQEWTIQEEPTASDRTIVGHQPPPPRPPSIPGQAFTDEELADLKMLPPSIPPRTCKSQHVPIYDNDHEVVEPFVQAAMANALRHSPPYTFQDVSITEQGDGDCQASEKGDEGIVRGDYVPKQREVEGAEEEEKEEEEEEEEEGGDDYGDTILQLTSSGSLKGVNRQASQATTSTYISDGYSPTLEPELVGTQMMLSFDGSHQDST